MELAAVNRTTVNATSTTTMAPIPAGRAAPGLPASSAVPQDIGDWASREVKCWPDTKEDDGGHAHHSEKQQHARVDTEMDPVRRGIEGHHRYRKRPNPDDRHTRSGYSRRQCQQQTLSE